MRGLSYVNISKDGASATIGGGTETGEVISALWSQGKLAGMYLVTYSFPFLFLFSFFLFVSCQRIPPQKDL